MEHATTTRVQQHIGDPVSEAAPVSRAKLEEIFKDIQSDLRFDHELNGCLNCGICTATCPSAHYYDYSPREIVQLLWTENLEGIYDAMQEKIWSCAQCYTCAAPLPIPEFSWRPCHDHARGRDQAWHAIGQGCAAAVLAGAAQGDLHR